VVTAPHWTSRLTWRPCLFVSADQTYVTSG
jgi:hypothetical protein